MHACLKGCRTNLRFKNSNTEERGNCDSRDMEYLMYKPGALDTILAKESESADTCVSVSDALEFKQRSMDKILCL